MNRQLLKCIIICTTLTYVNLHPLEENIQPNTSNLEKIDTKIGEVDTKTTTQKTQPDEVSYTLIASSASLSPSSSLSPHQISSSEATVKENDRTTENTVTKETATITTTSRPIRTRPSRSTKVPKVTTTSSKPTIVKVRPESKNGASKISAIAEETKNKKKVVTKLETKVGSENKNNSVEIPLSRKDWLKLIENEMLTYEKKTGNSPISNKNLTLISNRILKFLVDNGTTVGMDLREDKGKEMIIYHKGTSNVTINKVYGEGTETKFPPILEFVVSRIQGYFSVYAHNDTSRPLSWELSTQNSINATLREEPDDDDSSESSTSITGQDLVDQIEEQLSEYITIGDNNVTSIKLPQLIKVAYEKITSWLVPGKPDGKEEAVDEGGEVEEDEDNKDDKKKKKPSLFTTAVEAIETIWNVLDESDTSDEDTTEKDDDVKEDAELKEIPEAEIEKYSTIKESVSENIMDFINLAYTLYEAS